MCSEGTVISIGHFPQSRVKILRARLKVLDALIQATEDYARLKCQVEPTVMAFPIDQQSTSHAPPYLSIVKNAAK